MIKSINQVAFIILTLFLWSSSVHSSIHALQPGDMIKISMDNEPEMNRSFTVDFNGNLVLPEIDPIPVKKTSLNTTKTKIKRALSQVFRDLDSLKVTYHGSQILVQISGKVRNPNRVLGLPFRANLRQAINRSGGFAHNYTPGKVYIERKGRFIEFDYYRYLTDGNDKQLPVLQNLDKIFVIDKPLIEVKQVAAKTKVVTQKIAPKKEEAAAMDFGFKVRLMGSVRNPGTLQMLSGDNIITLISKAGGPTSRADISKIMIVSEDAKIRQFNMLTHKKNSNKDMPHLQQGDMIYIGDKEPNQQGDLIRKAANRVVHIVGHVNKPGRFEWSTKNTILDLIAHAGGPKEDADIADIRIIDTNPNSNTMRVKHFNLEKLMTRGGDITQLPPLDAGDMVVIPVLKKSKGASSGTYKSSWLDQPSHKSIYLFGEIHKPGRYAFEKSKNFLDILSAADGPTKQADLRNVRITHRNRGVPEVTKVNLARYFATGDESLMPHVIPGDTIYIPNHERNWLEQSKQDTIRVLGEVRKPGRYQFQDDMTILDLLAEAGGPNSQALTDKIIIVNMSYSSENAHLFDLDDFAKYPNRQKLPVLRAGDTIYVPNKENGKWNIFMKAFRDVFIILSTFDLVSDL